MNEDFKKCSKKIDILFLDNTFCDPVFTFPPRDEVLQEIEELVEKCKEKGNRVLIALDNLGK
jgi:DNA cross-link repair 1B protein